MRRTLVLIAVGLTTVVFPAGGSASVLCRTRTKTLVVRDACKRREEVVTPEQQVEVGMQGPAGRPGPSGPNFRDLKVTDATGRELGVVTSLFGYYGTANVVGTLAVPGSAAPGPWTFTVDGRGLSAQGSVCDPDVEYFSAPDCTGDGFANCDYGACAPTTAFLARPLYARDTGTACYAGDASEVRQGDFYRRFRIIGPTPADVAASCASARGTLVEPPAPCNKGHVPPNFDYCARCCLPRPNVSVSPIHTFDAGIVGTPPFRLSR